LRLGIRLLAFVAITVVSTRASAQVPQNSGRVVALPGARCDSAGSDVVTDSTIIPFENVDVPARLISLVNPVVPRSLKHTTARTVLELVVDATGKVDPCHVRLVEETAPAWTEAVLRALKTARYSPAQKYGLHVTVRFSQEFTATRP